MIAKITTVPDMRDEMISILQQSAADMPGCLSHIVAKDSAEENALWITEAWDSQASHDASLSLRQVQETIPRARLMITDFQRFATTIPLWGTGIRP
jgi:quinol monooxygenase YgiN